MLKYIFTGIVVTVNNISAKELSSPRPAPGRGPENTSTEEEPVLSNSRETARSLAQPEITANATEGVLPQVVTKAMNFGKNATSWLLSGAGLVGAGLAFGSYFVFNLGTLAFIFAVPAAMAFFLAYQLKHSVSETDNKASLDPIKGLRQIVEEKSLNQDTEKTLVLRYIKEAEKLTNIEARSEEAFEVLDAFRLMVDSKLDEISTAPDSNQELLQFKDELENYKDLLEDIDFPDEISETESSKKNS